MSDVAWALQTARQVGPVHPPHAHPHPIHKLHTGPLHSHVAGRTDHLPSNVPNGSYVLPADIVSAMGEGNTMAGFKIAKRMFEGARRHFGGLPYAGDNGPYGQSGGPYLVGHAKGGSVSNLTGKSREELERMDTDALDRAAWGHAQGDRLNIHPKHIKIKYRDDLVNPEDKFRKGGMNWARSVDFSEPAQVSIDRQGQYNLEDGHHRWYAANKLGRTLPSEISKIDGNPIDKILSNKPGMARGGSASGKQYPLAPRSEWYGDANYEQTGGRMTHISPIEYLSHARPMDPNEETARDNINDLKSHIKSGRTLDPLALYANGKEDGRHRAHAANELGIKSVPVLNWRPQNKAKGGQTVIGRNEKQTLVGPGYEEWQTQPLNGVINDPHNAVTGPVIPDGGPSFEEQLENNRNRQDIIDQHVGTPLAVGGGGIDPDEIIDSQGRAVGGAQPDRGVPVAVAGGEHVLAPHEVLYAGMGDLDAGHRALDEFVLRQRAKTVKTLKGLPGPKRD